MRADKKSWLKDSKARLIATVLGAISAAIAAGAFFDWRAALAVFVPAVVGCVIYSLQKLYKERKEKDSETE